MQNLALKIAWALQTVEHERGPFKVKCLIAQNPQDTQWDLILWADWFDADEFKRLNYLIEKIIKPLNEGLMAQFNAIITFGPDDDNDLLQSLRKIQDNYARGFYQTAWDEDILEVRASLPQACLVIPLNIQQKAAA